MPAELHPLQEVEDQVEALISCDGNTMRADFLRGIVRACCTQRARRIDVHRSERTGFKVRLMRLPPREAGEAQ
jgi:hypothetical protein